MFRRADETAAARRSGLVLGSGSGWWIHPFPDGTEVMDLLSADAREREEAADTAAQGDGLSLADVVLLPPLHPAPAMAPPVRSADPAAKPEGSLSMPPAALDVDSGPLDYLPVPSDVEGLVFTLDVAAVVGRAVRDATPQQARAAIRGVCMIGSWWDGAGEGTSPGPASPHGRILATRIGPLVVTPDELDDRRDRRGLLELEVTVRVNGRRNCVAKYTYTSRPLEEPVSQASSGGGVVPGELVASAGWFGRRCSGGTPEYRRSLSSPRLEIGDTVEILIERLGLIRSTLLPAA
ncbi:fumarylacetoacetate hydrolase family protein [Streptomyces sp. NPDC058867]|uniref:fumarylacetoacetate hydrolase family protein n=1 Tax=unclassified Streptomyces TaxID=2593676 RepID=UPI0036AA07E9